MSSFLSLSDDVFMRPTNQSKASILRGEVDEPKTVHAYQHLGVVAQAGGGAHQRPVVFLLPAAVAPRVAAAPPAAPLPLAPPGAAAVATVPSSGDRPGAPAVHQRQRRHHSRGPGRGHRHAPLPARAHTTAAAAAAANPNAYPRRPHRCRLPRAAGVRAGRRHQRLRRHFNATAAAAPMMRRRERERKARGGGGVEVDKGVGGGADDAVTVALKGIPFGDDTSDDAAAAAAAAIATAAAATAAARVGDLPGAGGVVVVGV